MERIEQVMSQIETIRANAASPPIPGRFRSLLEASIGNRPEGSSVAASAESVETPSLVAADWLMARQGVTLGAMVGSPSTGAARLGPIAGIATASQLAVYLDGGGVEARNGRLHASELVPVSGGWNGDARLLPPAASAWEQMRSAASLDGIDLRVIDSYRSYEAQARAHAAHLRGEKTANVLPPGHSEHGNGLAVDVTNGSIIDRGDPEWSWLQTNARRFGWYPISNETWHWEFRGVPG